MVVVVEGMGGKGGNGNRFSRRKTNADQKAKHPPLSPCKTGSYFSYPLGGGAFLSHLSSVP